MSEKNESLSPEVREWLAVRDEHILRLQQELADAAAALQKTEQVNRDLQALRREHKAYTDAFNQRTKSLEDEVQAWQSDYEKLRIQKGGFGFKALLATGMAATLFGMAVGWLFFRQKDPNAALFQEFSKTAGFTLEYQMAQKQYAAAEQTVSGYRHNKVFAPIDRELELIANLIRAVRSQGDTLPQLEGYAVVKADTFTAKDPTPSQILTITSETGATVHLEALQSAPVIARLKKKDQIGQWDRTPEPDKLKVSTKTAKGLAQDYWYEVETKDGQKGWVFGFYTNASLKQFKADSVVVKKVQHDSINK